MEKVRWLRTIAGTPSSDTPVCHLLQTVTVHVPAVVGLVSVTVVPAVYVKETPCKDKSR